MTSFDTASKNEKRVVTSSDNGTEVQLPLTESEKLAKFALSLKLEQIPADVVTLAKEHLLDVIGIALASTQFEFGPIVLKAAQTFGTGAEATAIGSGVALPATSAALVNGTLAHGLDFDDTHIGAVYHASAQAMAAAFASGQANKSSGREVLTAFIVGLEIGCRLASVGAGKFHDRAFHPTALCGTFASAAVAGRLYGAEYTALVWSLGLCGSMASGILESGKSWLKRLHPGWAAHSGMSALALGSAGFQGPNTVFEGNRGFYAAHIETVPEGPSSPTLDLGGTWQTLGIGLKPYPCCHLIHSFVDAALELRDQIALEDIVRIDCPLTGMLHKMVAEPRERCIHPTDSYAALFSVQYVVALALATGKVDLASFYDDPLDNPEILRIAEKTYCIDDPLSDFPKHFPGEVIVTLKDGRVLRSRKASSLGSPDVPLSRTAIEEKFLSNAERAIGRKAAVSIIEKILNLENVSSLDEIITLCTIR